MIDRRDISGFAVAILGHVGLVAALIFFTHRPDKPAQPSNQPIEVTLADDVGLVSAAPDPSTEPPAQAAQGDPAPPEPEAAPPEPTPEAKPDPTPPKPQPKPDTSDRHRPDHPSTQTSQPNPRSQTPKPTGQVSDPSKTNGPAQQPTDGQGTKSQATMTGEAQQNIVSAIVRQVKPCADRQVIPAPEARQILAIVQLRLTPDGALAGPVRILRHEGVDDSNERYVDRVDDAVEAIFAGCTPIRGLPAELYDVPRGWRQITFRYRLRN